MERPLSGAISQRSVGVVSRSSGACYSPQRSRGGGTPWVGERVVRSSSVPQLQLGGEQPSSPSAGSGSPFRGGTNGVPLLGRVTHNNIPGYSGFVPGKQSENVLGATHSRTNALALSVCSRRGQVSEPAPEHDFARRSNTHGFSVPRRGAEVPGYTGFIPAKHATNVCGTTFAQSNSVSQQVRRGQAAERPLRPAAAMAAAPLCWTGNAAAYAAAEAAVAAA